MKSLQQNLFHEIVKNCKVIINPKDLVLQVQNLLKVTNLEKITKDTAPTMRKKNRRC